MTFSNNSQPLQNPGNLFFPEYLGGLHFSTWRYMLGHSSWSQWGSFCSQVLSLFFNKTTFCTPHQKKKEKTKERKKKKETAIYVGIELTQNIKFIINTILIIIKRKMSMDIISFFIFDAITIQLKYWIK